MDCKTLADIVSQLVHIRDQDFIKTHRPGNTGIGKTLEDLLDIPENNRPGPDIRLPNGRDIELKATRTSTNSPITLFTLEPPTHERRYWNQDILNHAGYPDGDRQALYTTIKHNATNQQGFTLTISDTHITITHTELGRCARFGRNTISQKFETKFPELLLVEAHTIGTSDNEKFWYQTATHLTNFDIDAFYHLIETGTLVIELRMHLKPDGTLRNHGTAWRLPEDKLPSLFNKQTDLFTDQTTPTTPTYGQQRLTDF